MAASKCTACASERRAEIDTAIVALVSSRSVAKTFGLSKDAVGRHKKHIGQAIVKAAEARGEDLGATLLDKIQRLEQDLQRLAARAEHDGDVRAAITARAQLGAAIKLLHECVPAESSELNIVVTYTNDWREFSSGESRVREVQPPVPEVAS